MGEREVVESVPERNDHDPEEPGKAHARIVRWPFLAATARSAGAGGAKAAAGGGAAAIPNSKMPSDSRLAR